MTAVHSMQADTVAQPEWDLRVRLAAAYRILHHLGWKGRHTGAEGDGV